MKQVQTLSISYSNLVGTVIPNNRKLDLKDGVRYFERNSNGTFEIPE